MCKSCCGSLCSRETEQDESSGYDEPEGEEGPLYAKVMREEREASSIPGVIARRRRIRRLHCRTGFDIAIYPNGKIRGTKSPRNKYGLLEFEAVGRDGQLKIKGVVTGFYITMTPKGRIVGQPEKDGLGTVWIESRMGATTTYMSLLSQDFAHHGWYLAIKKSGKPKAGHKTAHPYPQKAISFLSRIVGEEFDTD